MCERLSTFKMPWSDRLKYESTDEMVTDEEKIKCSFVYEALLYLSKLLSVKEYEKAYQIADILHVFPDVQLSSRKSVKAFWKIYVLPYEKRHHDLFFEKLKMIVR